MASLRGPRGWRRRVKRVLLNAIAIGRVCASVLDAEGSLSGDTEDRNSADLNALRRENQMLKDELRIKDARMDRVPARKRPHYAPTERMEILELRAARGWSTRQTAQRFQVSEATISSWSRRADDPEGSLLKLREPVNKFPDLIRLAVQRLKKLCPRLGKDKIADMFCRLGLQISQSTVGRIVKEPALGSPEPTTQSDGPLVLAERPNQAWLIDLTTVPIGGFGFWVPWFPFSLPQCWPFCYWVGAILDVYSRRVQGVAIFRKEPTAKRIRSFLSRVASAAERKPRYLISDHDPVFDCGVINVWCGKHTRQRFGTIGQKGSIAIIERFFLTMKNEWTRTILVPMSVATFRRELLYFVDWYNGFRPHAGLAGRTPQEAWDGVQETPVDDGGGAIKLEFYKRRRHLPVLTKRKAA